jgi:hypothetical protein
LGASRWSLGWEEIQVDVRLLLGRGSRVKASTVVVVSTATNRSRRRNEEVEEEWGRLQRRAEAAFMVGRERGAPDMV